ncbi:MAG: sulfotransferase [Candidatus Nitrosocaldus sp.]|nr:sulfotransferase domain-containing protein [Candidatus Nitrosocaldus sp.]MDW8276115.1 sulfotransferase [Candidatus Nitrosocaldus sp.]
MMSKDTYSAYKPNLFVAGFSKCGTTALIGYLTEHPDIFIPWLKEPHALYTSSRLPSWASRGAIEDRVGKYGMSLSSYLSLYSSGVHYRYRVDGSTSYTFNTDTAKRIKEFNPDAKIIMCIRDQVERLISTYLYTYIHHRIDDLGEWLDKCFLDELDSFMFYDKIKTFYELFGFQMLVITNDDLKNNPQSTLNRVYTFLGLPIMDIEPRFLNLRFVTPFDDASYKLMTTVSRDIALTLLYLTRILHIEKYFWRSVNYLRYNNKSLSSYFVNRHTKFNRQYYDELMRKVPASIRERLESDYMESLEFIQRCRLA